MHLAIRNIDITRFDLLDLFPVEQKPDGRWSEIHWIS